MRMTTRQILTHTVRGADYTGVKNSLDPVTVTEVKDSDTEGVSL